MRLMCFAGSAQVHLLGLRAGSATDSFISEPVDAKQDRRCTMVRTRGHLFPWHMTPRGHGCGSSWYSVYAVRTAQYEATLRFEVVLGT